MQINLSGLIIPILSILLLNFLPTPPQTFIK